MTTPKSAEPGLTDEENEELWRANKWDRTVFGRAAYARGLAAGREAQRMEDAEVALNCALVKRPHKRVTIADTRSCIAAAIEGGRDELPSVVS
jgi:hypothetical protein